MRKRYPNIVRVLVALAMVASLVGIAVAPVSAQGISGVTPSPRTVSEAAQYTIDLTGANLDENDSIQLTFPSKVTLPGTIDQRYVSVAGLAYDEDDAPISVAQADNKVTITVSPRHGAALVGNVEVKIAQGAGITNPAKAKTEASAGYELSVSAGGVDHGKRPIGYIPSYKVSPSDAERFTPVTVTGKGWAGVSVTIDGAVEGNGDIEDDGTFSVTAYPADDGPVMVIDGDGQTNLDAKWDSPVTQRTFDLNARLVLTPTSGKVGMTLTVEGFDFTAIPGTTLDLVEVAGIDVLGPGAGTGLTTEDSWRDDDDFSVEVDVPLSLDGGGKTVKATDSAGKSAKATVTLAQPTLELKPNSGSVGDTLTVIGKNFGAVVGGLAGDVVDFGDGLWVEPGIETDAAGSFTISFDVPDNASPGYNEVVAQVGLDPITGFRTEAKSNYLVGDRLAKLTPDHGPMGLEVVLTGEDMTPLAEIIPNDVWIGKVNFLDFTRNIEIDSQGKVPPTEVTVPDNLKVGSNKVTIEDTAGIVAEGNYEVTQPTFEIDPERGYRADNIVATGTGWIPGGDELVTLKFGGKTVLTIEPDANGGFNARFDVPLDAGPSTEVTAKDTFANAAPTRIFTLEDEELSVDPQEGQAGSEATVKGIGFSPQFPAEELKIGGATILPLGGLVTDAMGSFEVTFTVPGLAEGSHTIEALIDGQRVTTFFTIIEAEDTVEDALENIMDVVVIVWGYDEEADEWLFFDPDDPASDLVFFTVGDGYWIKTDEATTLIYGGSSYSLPMGWKNIGWLGK